MKVLKYENRKADAVLFDISTPEKEAAAYLRLFKILDEEWQCYVDLEEDENLTCEACDDGQHKYCTGRESTCSCGTTPECANKNHRALVQKEAFEIQRNVYDQAKKGNWYAAKKLMTPSQGLRVRRRNR